MNPEDPPTKWSQAGQADEMATRQRDLASARQKQRNLDEFGSDEDTEVEQLESIPGEHEAKEPAAVETHPTRRCEDATLQPLPFWTIYHATALDIGCEKAALLRSIGSSIDDLEAALDEWSQADGVLVEQQNDDGNLSYPRIIGHLNAGKEVLLTGISPPTPHRE